MHAIAVPWIIKSYIKTFENLSKLTDIDSRVDSYFEIDKLLERDFNQYVKFAKNEGWKYPQEHQVELANQIKMVCEMRKNLTNMMIKDIEKL